MPLTVDLKDCFSSSDVVEEYGDEELARHMATATLVDSLEREGWLCFETREDCVGFVNDEHYVFTDEGGIVSFIVHHDNLLNDVLKNMSKGQIAAAIDLFEEALDAV